MKPIILLLAVLMNYGVFSQNNLYQFKHASPESKGFSSEKLDLLKQHLAASGSSSMMLLKDGEVFFEWGDTEKKHLIHSMRKALLNSLYGIAIAKGQIDTTATLGDLGINDINPLSQNELNARVVDVLKSRSGVYHNAAAANNAMLRDRPERNTHKPGEYYYYNNWDFNVAGAILEQETGLSIYEQFKSYIAEPLGMNQYAGKVEKLDGDSEEDFDLDTDGIYQYENSQSQFPAYHFRMSSKDLALYGLLYMNYGEWEGNQIIPKDWIDISTKPYSVYSPKYGNAYGMLWRVRVPDENTKRNSFFHTGVGVHMLGIYPDSGLILVHRVDTENQTNYQEGDFYKMLSLVFNSRL